LWRNSDEISDARPANRSYAGRPHGDDLGRRSNEAIAFVETTWTAKASARGGKFASDAAWAGRSANDRRPNRTYSGCSANCRGDVARGCADTKSQEAEVIVEARVSPAQLGIAAETAAARAIWISASKIGSVCARQAGRIFCAPSSADRVGATLRIWACRVDCHRPE